MSLIEYELDPAHFLSATGLAWQACLKKTGIKLELLTHNDMLLVIERIDMLKLIINTSKNYDKNKESSYFMY